MTIKLHPEAIHKTSTATKKKALPRRVRARPNYPVKRRMIHREGMEVGRFTAIIARKQETSESFSLWFPCLPMALPVNSLVCFTSLSVLARLTYLLALALWLQWWSDANEHSPNLHVGKYLGVYTVICLSSIMSLFASCW